MKTISLIFILVSSFVFGKEAKPAEKALVHPGITRLKHEIDKILPASKYRDLQSGIIAVSLKTGEILYEKNADELLVPASVNKLLTAYTAMRRMKATSTFKTTIHAVAPLKEGRLFGDLYIKGGGDPSLVSERMWMLVNELRRSGIKVVSGNLIGDATFFDLERTPDTRPKYLKDQAYNAPVGALSFNFNTTTIYVRPGETVGSAPIVYTDPDNSYIDVVNQAKTEKAGGKNTIVVSRTDYVKGDIGDTILLRGNLPIDHKELRFFRNIVNPTLYTLHMFKTFLERSGIKVEGHIEEGTVPSGARLILEFESLPLWQIIWGMNKFSNNFVADQITKKIGAEVSGPPGTLQKGVGAIENALEEIGIPKKAFKVVDGSGLTRNTHISARQLVAILKSGYYDFAVFPEFLASLGISGEDGTLKRRFSRLNGDMMVRAKTGSLDGVASLAGFSETVEGELVAFAIILNDPKVKYGKMSGWVDDIASQFCKFHRK